MIDVLTVTASLLALISLLVGVFILAYRIGYTAGQIAGINIARKNVLTIGRK